MSTAPLSYQQREAVRNLTAHPTAAQRYDNLAMYELEGPVDLACLEAAMHELAARHAALRTVVNGEQQRICEAGELNPVSYHEDDGTLAELTQSLLDSRYSLQDMLSGKPLFRVGVHRCDSKLILSILINHLVYDGWSLEVLWRDLAELYEARLQGRPAVLPTLPLTYEEVARRQVHRHEQLIDDAIAFYRKMIGGGDGAISWPAPDEPYDGPPTDVGAVELALTGPLTARVKGLSRQARVTPFVVLLTATAAAIGRVTAAAEVIGAVDTANRNDAGLQDVVGFLVNTRLVKFDLRAHEQILDLLAEVRGPWMQTERYGDAYYDQVLEALNWPHVVKVNMPGLSASWSIDQGPVLRDVVVKPLPVEIILSTWRDMSVFWFVNDDQYHAVLYHRRAAVSPATANIFGDQIVDVLNTGRL